MRKIKLLNVLFLYILDICVCYVCGGKFGPAER